MKTQYTTRADLITAFKKVILSNRSLAENNPSSLLKFREGALYLNSVPNLEAFNWFVNATLDLNE